jgi:hypothetical protein
MTYMPNGNCWRRVAFYKANTTYALWRTNKAISSFNKYSDAKYNANGGQGRSIDILIKRQFVFKLLLYKVWIVCSLSIHVLHTRPGVKYAWYTEPVKKPWRIHYK